MTRTELNLVSGAWVASGSGAWIDVVDPAQDGRVVAAVPSMTGGDVTAAIDAAAKGARQWQSVSGPDRGDILRRTAALLRERAPAIAADLVAEMGKTRAEAQGEVDRSADFFDYYSGFGRLPCGNVLPDRRADLTMTLNEPLGVVVAITPWNDPLLTPARKIAPALIAGNAVVLKAATDTPLVALHLARALHDAGLPAGVIGTVTGRGEDVAPALLSDARVAAVTFTGSTDVGMAVRKALADRNVRVQNEMGGKNAAVVMGDADLDIAVKTIMGAAFGQAGQRCTAMSRLLVATDCYQPVLERLARACAALRLGPGRDPDTTMGPLVSRRQQKAVIAAVEKAQADGARVVCGGQSPGGELACGSYVEPTILADVDTRMDIWRDEVFGPVLAVKPFDGVDQAIREVNDSPFGLSSALFTRDFGAMQAFMRGVDTGQVAINLSTSGWDVHIPFGGFRDSGSAFKEQGLEAVRFFTKVKTVSIAH